MPRTEGSAARDRGILMSYTLPTGTDLVMEVLNGNGKSEAGEEGYFDTDQWKNVFLRVSQGFGPVRVGGFGYSCNSFGTAPGGTGGRTASARPWARWS